MLGHQPREQERRSQDGGDPKYSGLAIEPGQGGRRSDCERRETRSNRYVYPEKGRELVVSNLTGSGLWRRPSPASLKSPRKAVRVPAIPASPKSWGESSLASNISVPIWRTSFTPCAPIATTPPRTDLRFSSSAAGRAKVRGRDECFRIEPPTLEVLRNRGCAQQRRSLCA